MYRFTRNVTIKNGASLPSALRAAGEIAAHVTQTYNMKMRVGAEMFGELNVQWSYDTDSLDAIAQLSAKLAQDKAYWEILETIKPFVLEGSVQDKVVAFSG